MTCKPRVITGAIIPNCAPKKLVPATGIITIIIRSEDELINAPDTPMHHREPVIQWNWSRRI